VTSTPADTGPLLVTGTTRVGVHPLRMRPASGSWVIGRVETGDFVSVPPVAERAIGLLAEGRTVDEIRSALLADGDDVDVVGFVTALAGLGFLSDVDGRTVDQPAPPRPTLPRLRPGHVSWLLHPVTAVASIAVIVAGFVAVLVEPALVPGYRDLIWSGSGGAVILGNATIAAAVVALHEVGHLATARAAGVSGRMSMGTRLQFLVVQTDVTGVWAEPRRTRMTVYLAGMVVNLLVAAGCVLVLAVAAPTGLAADLLAATALVSLLALPFEFLVFMRSDVYYVLQDLTGLRQPLRRRLGLRPLPGPPRVANDPARSAAGRSQPATAHRRTARRAGVHGDPGRRHRHLSGRRRGHNRARPAHPAGRRGIQDRFRCAGGAAVRRRRGDRCLRRSAGAVGTCLVAPPRPPDPRATRRPPGRQKGR
jgi:hypothetical protein